MVGTVVEERAEQRLIAALLVAIGALVLPVSGALQYLDLFNADGPFEPWIVPFVGASNAADVLGPVLLAGALGLGIVVSRSRSASSTLTRALAMVVVFGALAQGAAFLVTGFDLLISRSYAIPDTTAWQTAKWTVFVRMVVQALVCLAALVLAIRWLDLTDRKVDG